MRKRRFKGPSSKRPLKKRRTKFGSLMNKQLSTLRDKNYFDTTISGTLATTTASQTLLFIPTVGTGSTSRYGDKTIMRSISWSYFINPAAANGAFRVILYYDRQANGAAPVAPDPLIANGAHTFKNPDLRHRYLILRDWCINADASNSGLANSNRDFIQKGRLTVSLPTVFTASAGVIGDIATGSLYLYMYNALNATVGITGTVRVLFDS